MIKEITVLCVIGIFFSHSTPLMLDQKADFIQTIQKTNLAVFFYGTQNSEQYQAFEMAIPSDKELFADLQFYFIPSESIKLAKEPQSLFIFRNIPDNEWLSFDKPFNPNIISEWVRHNCFENFPQLKGEDIDDMFVNKKKGFILLDFDNFELLATKILLHDYCQEKGFLCGKCTIKNKILNMVVQLMRADNEPGVPKLAFWDPNTQKFELFTKAPLSQITREHLDEIVEGREGLVKPQTTINSEQVKTEDEL